MKQVKSWQPVFKMLKTHLGNSIIDKRNKTAIETYNAIEAIKVPGDRFKSLEGLCIMHRGERL